MLGEQTVEPEPSRALEVIEARAFIGWPSSGAFIGCHAVEHLVADRAGQLIARRRDDRPRPPPDAHPHGPVLLSFLDCGPGWRSEWPGQLLACAAVPDSERSGRRPRERGEQQRVDLSGLRLQLLLEHAGVEIEYATDRPWRGIVESDRVPARRGQQVRLRARSR